MKIGIMGGTFNPIHNGHLEIARSAYEQYQLDEVWFMPNRTPAYKETEDILSGDIRLRMIQCAMIGYPHFKASDFELKRSGNTYTWETMELLNQKYTDVSFYFIMGADSLFQFTTWMYPERIVQYTRILAASRDENNRNDIVKKCREYNQLYQREVFFPLTNLKINCSSHDIREKIKKLDWNQDLDEDLPQRLEIPREVFSFIKKYNLYRGENERN